MVSGIKDTIFTRTGAKYHVCYGRKPKMQWPLPDVLTGYRIPGRHNTGPAMDGIERFCGEHVYNHNN